MTEQSLDRYDVLDDPLFSVRNAGGNSLQVSLGTALEAMGAGEELEFIGLRAHQQHAWHSFLVQAGAMALLRAPGSTPLAQSAKDWSSSLRRLAGGNPRAWWLLNENLVEPAFMQPPIPSGTLDDFADEVRRTPDEEDVIIVAKNHDMKATQMLRPKPEHWIFALVSMQTMGAFGGRSWYSIARMNGGSSSRPSLGATPSLYSASRWRRDVNRLLGKREEILRDNPMYAPKDGDTLLWTIPWDGTEALSLDRLDPFFVEVCRRLRVVGFKGGLALRATGTSGSRVMAGALKGNTGDAWTPVKVPEGKALTASARSFHYAKLQELLFSSEYRHPVAQEVAPGDGATPWFVGQVLVAGNCTTDGYQERLLPLPPAVRRRLLAPDGALSLGSLANERVQVADTVRRKILRPALLVALQGAPEKLKNDDRSADRWLDKLDARIDAQFFDSLWTSLEAIDAAVDAGELDRQRTVWARWLLAEANLELQRALRFCPIPAARRHKAFAASESMFAAASRKNFPSLFESGEAASQTTKEAGA